MNKREFRCVELLTDLVENHGMVGIKTSFEDEGATFNEVVRLKQICNEAKTKITLKIGGPEAIRDIQDSAIIGVKGLVAPMVESPFGVQKFIGAVKKYISPDSVSSLQLLVNIETMTAVKNIADIMEIDDIFSLYGITLGRVDLVSSLGEDRNFVESPFVFDMAEKVFTLAKEKGLKACVGGAVSTESYSFLSRLHSKRLLDKFETRYVMYDPAVALKNLPAALAKGQMFEYEWLMVKREHYMGFADADLKRIHMIQERINQSIKVD